jgi:hypothetical protein
MTERSRPWDGTTTGDATDAPYDAATEWARIMRATNPAMEATANKGGVVVGATGFNDLTTSSPSANTQRVHVVRKRRQCRRHDPNTSDCDAH